MKRSTTTTLLTLLAAGALAVLSSTAFASTSTLVTDSTTGHSYQADYTNRTYAAAQADCTSKGAHLAVFSNNHEYLYIQGFVISQSPSRNYTFGVKFPAYATTPVTINGDAYYQAPDQRNFITVNDSTPDYLKYVPLAGQYPAYGFYWQEGVNDPYICEWD